MAHRRFGEAPRKTHRFEGCTIPSERRRSKTSPEQLRHWLRPSTTIRGRTGASRLQITRFGFAVAHRTQIVDGPMVTTMGVELKFGITREADESPAPRAR